MPRDPRIMCFRCDGQGMVRSDAWAKWWELEDQLYQEFYRRHRNSTQDRWFASEELAQLTGARPSVPPQISCPACSGRGTVNARPMAAAGGRRSPYL